MVAPPVLGEHNSEVLGPIRERIQARQPSEYVRENFYVTTSGVCSDPALRCTIDTLGIDRVMFSIDYPFESTEIASRWISSANVTDSERASVAYQNATRVLRI